MDRMQLFEALRALPAPTARAWAAQRPEEAPCVQVVCNEFGSWAGFVAAAGIDHRAPRSDAWSMDDVYARLSDLVAQGKRPTLRNYDTDRPAHLPAGDTVARRMHWNTVAANAVHWEREQMRQRIINAIKAMSSNGFAPSQARWDKEKPDGLPSSQAIRKHMEGGWRELINGLGLKTRSVKRPRPFRRLPAITPDSVNIFVPWQDFTIDPVAQGYAMPDECDCGHKATWIMVFWCRGTNAMSLCNDCKQLEESE